ncbi:hypothetical protein DV737_g582, partial [Chaetothyriales sp. CBS 132003]
MDFLDEKCETLLVSTMDRHITKVEVASGTVIESSKITDPENEDTVALNRIAIIGHRGLAEGDTSLLVGVSSADKSLRVYDADKNLLLTREHGHTEGISDMLRRPPSVPTDLRGQAMAYGRRQSMNQTSDFGSVVMATEQTCRMLRAYLKKLMGSKEELALDELEVELEKVVKAVREKKGTTAKAVTQNDADEPEPAKAKESF